VVIPEGQTVLLDISPPRLYLLLIEGTLIFDRRDIELKVIVGKCWSSLSTQTLILFILNTSL
jgi:hypothetical protein